MGAKQQEYTVIPGGEAGGILPPEGCSRESRIEKIEVLEFDHHAHSLLSTACPASSFQRDKESVRCST